MQLSRLHTEDPSKSLQDTAAAPVGREANVLPFLTVYSPMWNPPFLVFPSLPVHPIPNVPIASSGGPKLLFLSKVGNMMLMVSYTKMVFYTRMVLSSMSTKRPALEYCGVLDSNGAKVVRVKGLKERLRAN